MRGWIRVCVLCSSSALAAGQELVPNNSFEQSTSCPTANSQLSLADPWIPPTLGTPDYFNPCNPDPATVSVPVNAVGEQAAFEGSSYAGFIALVGAGGLPDYREYVQAELLGGALEAGKTYRFSMQLCLAEDSSAATDRIGAYLSPTAVGSGGFDPLPFTPQFETPLGTYLDDFVEWMDYSDTFVAAGGEQFITIGNFHDAVDSGAVSAGLGPNPPLQLGTCYYYLDVVSLQCEPCVEPDLDMNAWWPLDEEDLGTVYEVVAANHGLPVGTPVPVPGHVGNALEFAGNGVSVASSVGTELGSADFSLDLWVRPAALGGTQALVAKLAGPLSTGYALVLNPDGTVTFSMIDDVLGMATVTSGPALVPGQWSLVAVTVDRDDPAGGRLYVDGSSTGFDPTTATGSLSNTLPLLFATDGGAGVGADYTGALDEIELFHAVLSPGEVLALTQARTSGKCKAYLELEPVVGVPVDGGTPITTTPVITTSGGGIGVGTFTVSVAAAPPGTKVGALTSNVVGPANPRVLTPQPIRVDPGQSVPVRLSLGVPPQLRHGKLAAYTVTVTHLETGRTFLGRGLLRGDKQRRRAAPQLR